MKFYSVLLIIFFYGLTSLSAQLDIGFWNIANKPNDAQDDATFTTVFAAIDKPEAFAVAECDTGSLDRLTIILQTVYSATYHSVRSSSVGGDITAIFYDPSYGIEYTSLPDIEKSIAGFGKKTTANINELTYNIDLDGNGVIENKLVNVDIINIRKEDPTVNDEIRADYIDYAP